MLNYAIKVIVAALVAFFLLLNPEVVGVWDAKKDIAYNSYMDLHYQYDESQE